MSAAIALGVVLFLVIVYVILIHTMKSVREWVGLEPDPVTCPDPVVCPDPCDIRVGMKYDTSVDSVHKISKEINEIIDFVAKKGCAELKKQKQTIMTAIDDLPDSGNSKTCSSAIREIEDMLKAGKNRLEQSPSWEADYVSQTDADFVIRKIMKFTRLFMGFVCKDDKADKAAFKMMISDIIDAFCV